MSRYFKFKDTAIFPIGLEGAYYALFNEEVMPEDLLVDENKVREVNKALETISDLIQEAFEAGIVRDV